MAQEETGMMTQAVEDRPELDVNSSNKEEMFEMGLER